MSGDLLNKLGTKASTEGTGSPASSQGQANGMTGIKSDHSTRGANLIDQVGKKSESTAATESQTSVEAQETNTSTTKVETSSTTGSESSSWTVESALKEVKKLREENKASRLKYEENVEQLKKDMDLRVNATKQEVEHAMQAKKELEELKAKEADRKRNLEERLAHRENLIGELTSRVDTVEKSYKEKLQAAETQLNMYKTEIEAQNEVYKTRLAQELAVIPEKFKDVASYIVKGAGDPRDALVAISEAKIKGLFEDKAVFVNHSVPGAADGARITSKTVQDSAKADREKMTPQQKIRAALQEAYKGQPNSAFRQK